MPSHVQSKAHQDDASSLTEAVAFDSNVTAGNLIFVSFTFDSAGSVTSDIDSLTDTLGNTYTKIAIVEDTTANQTYGFYYAKNILGGACTVTVNYFTIDSVEFRRITVSEYSGCTCAKNYADSGYPSTDFYNTSRPQGTNGDGGPFEVVGG